MQLDKNALEALRRCINLAADAIGGSHITVQKARNTLRDLAALPPAGQTAEGFVMVPRDRVLAINCPRPANGRPDDETCGTCVAAGMCGCEYGTWIAAVDDTSDEIASAIRSRAATQEAGT